ncbi:3-deoxy-7-phosphoheptulonate synthase [Apophysomyces sp. BC1034]|nr:3-deoxy-7-phosphoheptulonate synthase [Apophysomyces sp. BC1015]KAG0170091.1 3-deoxy-7-phosphoheptulonate synthase [Apophysomyces sp. BC1021]KAG0184547.1 3-deoxy-7-phosphoheptulonate synthase [Apophysomyces sp. BC1034]
MVDVRIEGYNALLSPSFIAEEFPLSSESRQTVITARQEIAEILAKQDDRLIVIIGPCSIHDSLAAKEYCKLLLEAKERLKDELCIVMRSYFEKPRTTVGWKGLINDPDINERQVVKAIRGSKNPKLGVFSSSFDINKGLRISRGLLCDITAMGMPVAVELLDTISPQYLADLVSWGAIGARTTESQLHREMASGTSFPIGFKNGTDGNLGIAVDAIRAAAVPHHFLGITRAGVTAITHTTGNPDCHIILRGGNKGPNYDAQSVLEAKKQLQKAQMTPTLMVDCSHGNSSKDHRNQPKVAKCLADQIEAGEDCLVGVMIESHLHEGKQSVPEDGPVALKYGISITDGCIDWDSSEDVLESLAEAVRARRAKRTSDNP